MFSRVRTGLFACFIISGCNCDENLSRLNASIEADPPELDFGLVPRGFLLEKQLKLRNKGSITLLLDGYEAAAPFIAPTGTSSIVVGGEIEVTVGFRPTELGPMMGVLEISSNDPEVPITMIPLRGEGIEAAIEVDPLTVDFGEVLWNSQTVMETRTVRISNPGSDDFDLTSLVLEADGAGAFTIDKMDTEKTYAPGDSAMFSVTHLPNARGNITGSVKLTTTAPDAEEIVVQLVANVVGPQLEICSAADNTPETCTENGDVPRVDMLLVPINGAGHGNIRLMNSGNRDLTLFGYTVAGQADELSFAPDSASLNMVSIAPGTERTLETFYTPMDYAFDRVTLIVNNDSPPMTVSSIAVQGSVGRPNIEAIPLMITMSLTAPSDVARVNVDVLNCGEEVMTFMANTVINQTSGPTPAFRIENAPTNGTTVSPQDCTTNPPAMVSFDVVFETTTNGFYEAEVPLITNDPVDPTLTVQVSGSRN